MLAQIKKKERKVLRIVLDFVGMTGEITNN